MSRTPTPDECRLLQELATVAGIEQPDAWTSSLQVEDMDDDGMGSLALMAPESTEARRGVVACRAAVQFTDADGVEVELDIWKTDFSRLRRIPLQFRRLKE